MFAYDLFSLTSDLCLQYTSILGWCANRSEVWRSLKKEMDLSFQLESAEFYARGLPLCRCSICQNFASPSTRPLICRWAD